jgi:hypothetical protein
MRTSGGQIKCVGCGHGKVRHFMPVHEIAIIIPCTQSSLNLTQYINTILGTHKLQKEIC